MDDHTQAGNDHTRAESDHGIAADDHTQAGTDHQTAAADHQTAGADHTQAGNDHSRAESDHTRAESDHAAVEVYVDSLGAFDISAYNATGGVLAKYADLTAALGTNGANIPDAIRKGGMSVKFVLSSDNKYVQYRLMDNAWSTNTDDWSFYGDDVLVDSPEFIETKADSEGKLLEARKVDGTKVEYCDLEVKGNIITKEGTLQEQLDNAVSEIMDDVEQELAPVQETLSFFEPTDTPEYSEITTDSEGKIVSYRNGSGVIVENIGIEIGKLGNLGDNIKKQIHDCIKEDNVGDYDKWVNEYPNILDSLQFKEKWLKREDDITVLVIGDSLSAFHNQAPYPYDVQANRPCQMICHNWVGNTWNYLNDIPVVADRFDSEINSFTETGTWDDGYAMFGADLPTWTAEAMTNNGKNESGSLTRYSNSSGASVAFSWDLSAQEKLHFIHRRDYRAADNVTISVSGGNGKVLVYDDDSSQWVEANGYQFTQKIAQSTQGSGYAQTLSNWRLKMKKAVGATGSVTLTFTASGSGYLFYWGTERWNGNRLILVNSSRGGRECKFFQNVIKNDVAERKPDLVLVSCMLINEYGEEAIYSHDGNVIVNHVQDFIFGDRDGHTTDLSMKVQSNNWQDFEVLTIIPHIRYEYFKENESSVFKTDSIDGNPSWYMNEIAPIVWSKVRQMMSSKGIGVIDIYSAIKRAALSRGWEYKDTFNSHGMDSLDGFTADTVHQNVLGSMIWAKHIAPIFDI